MTSSLQPLAVGSVPPFGDLPAFNYSNQSISQNRLLLALSSARMGTWDWDVQGGRFEWDDRMHALFGLAPGEFSGPYEDFLLLVDPADRENVYREMRAAATGCAEYDGEFGVVWPSDGSLHTVRMRATVHEGNGAGLHAVGVAWDTTTRRATERALDIKRNYFNALMENIPDHIYFKDLESRLTVVNRAMAKWVGYEDPAELIDKTDSDLFGKEHAAQALLDEKEIIRTGVPIVNVEEKETWTDGHESWVSTTKMPLRDVRRNGEIIGTFGLSRDITEKKRVQEELRMAVGELRKKNAALEADLAMARELQSAMMPGHIPSFPRNSNTSSRSAVQFFHFYQPSSAVSGDFFDVFEIDDNRAGLFICDVMGHGTRAALVAAILRTLASELSEYWHEPGEFLTKLNHSIRSALRNTEDPVFASAFYVVTDLVRREFRFANAGHPRPMRIPLGVQLNGQAGALPLGGGHPGPALGLFDEPVYETSQSPLTEHDRIVLFTDGLFEVEGRNGEMYDYGKLVSAMNRRTAMSAPDLCRGVVDEIQAFSGHREFEDDVCLVAMEIGPVKV